tara:strand:+ start:34 stop:801 length:768 start_codon:yes stop_codon:yes gene_type:complete
MQVQNKVSLAVSETFYSIQGEGPTAGKPSLFLRLKGCNLTCGGKRTVKTGELDSGATWRCDSIESWIQGENYSADDMINQWKKKNWLKQLKQNSHLIITGGEPLLHQKDLRLFIPYLIEKLDGTCPYIEVETNGTITPHPELDRFVSQYNISPKLKNSGMPKNKRILAHPIEWFAKNKKSRFKFVVSNKDDIDESIKTFILPFNLNNKHIYLMPASSSQADIHQKSQDIIKLCKIYGFSYSPRLQILLWDQATGI